MLRFTARNILPAVPNPIKNLRAENADLISIDFSAELGYEITDKNIWAYERLWVNSQVGVYANVFPTRLKDNLDQYSTAIVQDAGVGMELLFELGLRSILTSLGGHQARNT